MKFTGQFARSGPGMACRNALICLALSWRGAHGFPEPDSAVRTSLRRDLPRPRLALPADCRDHVSGVRAIGTMTATGRRRVRRTGGPPRCANAPRDATYSWRSTTIGSTRVARHAGTIALARPTTAITINAAATATASAGPTP